MVKKIGIALLAILLVMQFFRIDKENPVSEPSNDFISITAPSEPIKQKLKAACYDCHSNQTVYPWYSNIAPISFLLKNHIDDGRKHLNFSDWGSYSTKKQEHKLEEMVEEVESGNMPDGGYTLMHSEAKFTETEKAEFINWIKNI